jgi:hypothetical protein
VLVLALGFALALVLALPLAPSFALPAFLLISTSSSLSRISITSGGEFLFTLTGADALAGFPKRFLDALFDTNRFFFLIGCTASAGPSSPDEMSMISALEGGGM